MGAPKCFGAIVTFRLQRTTCHEDADAQEKFHYSSNDSDARWANAIQWERLMQE